MTASCNELSFNCVGKAWQAVIQPWWNRWDEMGALPAVGHHHHYSHHHQQWAEGKRTTQSDHLKFLGGICDIYSWLTFSFFSWIWSFYHISFITLLWNKSLLKLWEMDTSIQVVSEFQRRAVIAIVIVMEEWSSGDESLESSLVSEFFNILLSLWHSFITSTLVRSDFLPNQIFFVYLMTVYQ